MAAAITIQYWDSGVNSDVFVIIFWLAITFITLFGVKAFGEVEFVLSTLKILAVIGFVILGIVLIAGGVLPMNLLVGNIGIIQVLLLPGLKVSLHVLLQLLFLMEVQRWLD